MSGPVTREGVLSGGNRVQARSSARWLILLSQERNGTVQPKVDDLDNFIDEITALVLKQVEEDRQARYGGRNEGA